jgi:ABC-type multidrug transport system ATPase subunit
MPDDLAIDVRGMTKRFGDRIVVNDIALQVRTGEIYGFLGPNGSGKTTFIRMLCGLLRADAGSGTCLGYDVITESAAIKRHVGYMTQKFSFWEDLSIAENLDFVARMYDVKDRKQAVQKSIEQLVWRVGSDNSQVSSPAAGNSGSHSPRVLSMSRSCSCSMNRPRELIRRRGAIFGNRFIGSPRMG